MKKVFTVYSKGNDESTGSGFGKAFFFLDIFRLFWEWAESSLSFSNSAAVVTLAHFRRSFILIMGNIQKMEKKLVNYMVCRSSNFKLSKTYNSTIFWPILYILHSTQNVLRINDISDHFSYLLKIDLMNHTHILDEYI